jgi:hypothetical protein
VLYRVEGGPGRPVPGSAGPDEPLRWATDGRWLFVRRTPRLAPNITRVWIDRIDVAQGRREPWKELAPGDPAGVRAIGPIFLAPDGRGYVYQFVCRLGNLYLAEGLR